jgi:sortase A
MRSFRVLSTVCFIAGAALLAWPLFHSALSGYATGRVQAEALAAWDKPPQQQHEATPGVPSQAMVLEIPRLSLRRVVPEGATVPQLQRYGVGHISWTAFPPKDGAAIPLPGWAAGTLPNANTQNPDHTRTVGIAGHRTTYGAPFFRLGELTPGDQIVLQYAGRRYVYRMERRITALPADSDLLDGSDDEIALVTCTPAFSAAYRLIVFGRLQSATALLGTR